LKHFKNSFMEAIHLDQFPKISMAEWKAAIEQELKGRAWESLIWQPEAGIALDPAYHKDNPIVSRLLPNIRQGRWKIGEQFVVDDPGGTNAQILEALQMGLDAPEIILKGSADLSSILSGVVTNYIDITWRVEGNEDIHHYIDVMKGNSDGSSPIQGGWIQPKTAGHSLGTELKKLIDTYTQESYDIRYVAIEQDSTLSYGAILGRSLSAINGILIRALEAGCQAPLVLQSIAVRIPIKDSLLLSVAALRAMRLLYLNLTTKYKIGQVRPLFLDAYTDRQSYVEDAHYNRIKGSLMGWSAVVGGADRITISPGSLQMNNPFERRIARNVHHLLAMESHLDKVADPLSGSYYIETATSQLASAAWTYFQESEASQLFLDGEPLIYGNEVK
jgi:methylmalonyl-CoA mutase